MIEPEAGLKVLISKTVYTAAISPKVCMMNISDRYVLMKKGRLVAQACEVDEISAVSEQMAGTQLSGICMAVRYM